MEADRKFPILARNLTLVIQHAVSFFVNDPGSWNDDDDDTFISILGNS
jgi:hypothetical protein